MNSASPTYQAQRWKSVVSTEALFSPLVVTMPSSPISTGYSLPPLEGTRATSAPQVHCLNIVATVFTLAISLGKRTPLLRSRTEEQAHPIRFSCPPVSCPLSPVLCPLPQPYRLCNKVPIRVAIRPHHHRLSLGQPVRGRVAARARLHHEVIDRVDPHQ